MGNWRDLAARRVGEADWRGASPSFHGLSGDLTRNLRMLRNLPPPQKADHRAWTRTVADAIAIASGGWASAALSLGWTELDLFGIGPIDSWEFSGLAVWLDGRTLTALDDRMAFAGNAQSRSAFNRRGWGHGRDIGLGAPVPLWSWGRS